MMKLIETDANKADFVMSVNVSICLQWTGKKWCGDIKLWRLLETFGDIYRLLLRKNMEIEQ